MKNIYLFCYLILLFHNIINGSEVYQSIRVYSPTNQIIQTIGQLGIPLDHINGKKDVFIDLVVTTDQTIELLSRDIVLDILVEDLTMHYKSRNQYGIDRDFPLGSMQGNYTFDELNNRFDELHMLYPEIISNRIIIGQTIEERDIWAFKVSDNPNVEEDEPAVLFTALTHAREPVGMMSLFYFVQKLAEEYETDAELEYLINNREMWFIPVVNPDGYVYNEEIEPDGGGMHRKNRLDTNCGDGTGRGVDLNRNYGYGWGSDNTGSSPNPCSATYRGESSFSELETQVVRDFIIEYDFMNVLHYHTFSNIYIHPWGDGSLPEEPDLTTLREIGEEMARYNGYVVGTGLSTIGYTVNGDAVDWTFGDQNIISYVPEVGSPSQGFWPSEDEIVDLCSNQFYPNKIFSFVSGPDIIVHSYQFSEEDILPGDSVEIEIVIQNRGLQNSNGDIDVSLNALNDIIGINIDSYEMSEIDARDQDEFSITISVSENADYGSHSGIVISLQNDFSYSRTDTINFVIGQREMIFFDGFENGLVNWSVNGDWGLTDDAPTDSLALTDSPNGDYQEAFESIAELTYEINFNYILYPVIEYKAKWEIEEGWDFVRFQAYVLDSGWVSLEGNYTGLGSGQPAQPFGQHGYDGNQENWIEETIYIDQLIGETITGFRFIQTSDNFVEGDGFTFDDFSISGFAIGLMGDFNQDLHVDIYDLLAIVDIIFLGNEPTESQLFFCDIDRSGQIDVMDLIGISNIILGIEW